MATLLNNFQIRNDLGTNKNINNERAKFGLGMDDDEDCKSKYQVDVFQCTCYLNYRFVLGAFGSQYDHTSLKNKDADLGNPNLNIYHSIDEVEGKKVEHVYDEIKNSADTEYDHLDHTRSLSAWKPHYQRMVNGIHSRIPPDGAGTSKKKDKDPDWGEV